MTSEGWKRVILWLLLLLSVTANYILWQSAQHDDLALKLLRADIIPVCLD